MEEVVLCAGGSVMNAETIGGLLRRQPFEPFEIRMSNGDIHQVRHPEMVLIVGSRFVVGYPETDRIVILSLLHITAIEMVQLAS
jgi:hypothetical protein